MTRAKAKALPALELPWEDVRLFLAVAETRSFTEAARRLRLGQPTVSRRVSQLEDALGFRLFHRHPTGASVTAEAERLLEPSRRMAEWAGEVARSISKGDQGLSGVVRVAAAPGVSFDFVTPFAASLQTREPGIVVSCLSSVGYVDVARGEADLALRGRAPVSADLHVVETFKFRNAVFVSRGYQARLPRRPKISDLGWVAWAPPFDDVTPNPQLRQLIPGFRPVFTADNFLILQRAAEAGVGAIVLSLTRHRLAPPSPLVALDIDLGPFAFAEMHLVCAKSALAIPRVRRVAEALADELQRSIPR